jgi:hypothetical protein
MSEELDVDGNTILITLDHRYEFVALFRMEEIS